MTQQDLRHWLALNVLLPLLSSRRSYQLLQYYGSPANIFAAGAKSWLERGLSEQAIRALSSPDWQAVEQAQCWAEKPGNHIITYTSEHFPSLLKEISDPPLVLYCQGDPQLLKQHQLAIVGSRNPTPGGYETAQAFAMQLAKTGFVITSGLAIGIDGAAHRGALQAECNTIAVTGSGLDRIYPARHQELAERIRQSGLLLSEFPLGSAPIGRHFPMRNRIISGLIPWCIDCRGGTA